jgi:hypothetical protein
MRTQDLSIDLRPIFKYHPAGLYFELLTRPLNKLQNSSCISSNNTQV